MLGDHQKYVLGWCLHQMLMLPSGALALYTLEQIRSKFPHQFGNNHSSQVHLNLTDEPPNFEYQGT